MPRRALALLLVPLAAACTPGGDSQAVEAMIEVKLEMRMAIDELKTARSALDDSRAELDRARADLDRSRQALNKALERAARDPQEIDDADLRPSLDRTLDPEIVSGLTCAEEGVCRASRSALDKILDNPAGLAKQARVVPSMKDGASQGFKLYGIRRDSLPKLLGLKNGDMITAINGKSLLTLDDAMAAYTALRGAKKIDLVGERKGEPFTVSVTITND